MSAPNRGVMSLEGKMIRIILVIVATLILSSCAGTGLQSYDCMQFEKEPHWNQVALDFQLEERLIKMIEAHYSNAPKEAFLMNKGNKRKYFWYKAESGEILVCIVDGRKWRQYHEGCFADRFIISESNSGTTLKETESVVCT